MTDQQDNIEKDDILGDSPGKVDIETPPEKSNHEFEEQKSDLDLQFPNEDDDNNDLRNNAE